MGRKPKLFIGSSSLAIESKVMETFKRSVETHLIPVAWTDEPEFQKGSRSTLQALIAAVNKYDFAAFLFTPDDKLIRAGDTQTYACARDNVVFEYGLFLSTLGAERVFPYKRSTSGSFWLMSDVHGISMPQFEFPSDEQERLSNLQAATRGLRDAAERLSFRPIFLNILSKWGASAETQDFTVRLNPFRLRLANVSNYKVCAVARVKNELIDCDADLNIHKSDLRAIRPDISEEIVLKCQGFGGAIQPGCTVQGTILLVPQDVGIDQFRTVDEARSLGCRDVQKPDYHL